MSTLLNIDTTEIKVSTEIDDIIFTSSPLSLIFEEQEKIQKKSHFGVFPLSLQS